MGKPFGRDELLAAFDEIGGAAKDARTVLHFAVYGGSALILASNFRFVSEDVDIGELPAPWPSWLTRCVDDIATRNGWSHDWLNEAVHVHLSENASLGADHVAYGTFPRDDEEPGLVVYVPKPSYMLALKLKAIRVLDPARGEQEAHDIRNLMRVTGVTTPEDAVAILARYFPRSGADADKQLFLLRHVLKTGTAHDAPEYPRGSL